MTNKEFQEILAQYPDDYTIQMDNAFGWEVPTNKHKVDPYLYINTDCGFIEIEPPEIRDIWVKPSKELPNDFTPCIFKQGFYMDGNLWDYIDEYGSYSPEDKAFTYWDCYTDCEVKVKPEEVIVYIPIPKYEKD